MPVPSGPWHPVFQTQTNSFLNFVDCFNQFLLGGNDGDEFRLSIYNHRRQIGETHLLRSCNIVFYVISVYYIICNTSNYSSIRYRSK
jgi:hypothetical protein